MKEDDRIITSSMRQEDESTEYSLRPRFLSEYIGQEQVKEHMAIYIEAAKIAENLWITLCFTARPAWAKPHWPGSSPTKWA